MWVSDVATRGENVVRGQLKGIVREWTRISTNLCAYSRAFVLFADDSYAVAGLANAAISLINDGVGVCVGVKATLGYHVAKQNATGRSQVHSQARD